VIGNGHAGFGRGPEETGRSKATAPLAYLGALRRSSPPAFDSFPLPGPVGPWRDDGSREADQPQAIRRALGDQPPPVRARALMAFSQRALMAFSHEQREPVVRVVLDQVEVTGRVSVAKIARTTAQVPAPDRGTRRDAPCSTNWWSRSPIPRAEPSALLAPSRSTRRARHHRRLRQANEGQHGPAHTSSRSRRIPP
jgi:hypothetical protein